MTSQVPDPSPLRVYLRPVGMSSAWDTNPHVPRTAAQFLDIVDECWDGGRGPVVGVHVHAFDPGSTGSRPQWSTDPEQYVSLSAMLDQHYPGLVHDLDLNPLPEPQRWPTFLASSASRYSLWPSRISSDDELAARCRAAQDASRVVNLRVIGPEDLDRGIRVLVRPEILAEPTTVILSTASRTDPFSPDSYRRVRAAVPPRTTLFVQLTASVTADQVRTIIENGDHVVTGLSEIDGLDSFPVSNRALVDRIADIARAAGRPLACPDPSSDWSSAGGSATTANRGTWS